MATCKDCFHWNACKKMLEAMWGHSVPSGYEGGADRCEDFISTADVAPRAEVAREIFEEIEQTCRVCGAFGVRGYIMDDVANLKKKYTEERPDGN